MSGVRVNGVAGWDAATPLGTTTHDYHHALITWSTRLPCTRFQVRQVRVEFSSLLDLLDLLRELKPLALRFDVCLRSHAGDSWHWEWSRPTIRVRSSRRRGELVP